MPLPANNCPVARTYDYVDVLLDDSAQLVYGFYQHASHEGLFEILGLRLDPGAAPVTSAVRPVKSKVRLPIAVPFLVCRS